MGVRTAGYEGTLTPEAQTFTYNGTIVYTSSFYDGSYHSAQVGKAVQLVSSGEVGLGGANGILAGRLESVEADACTVTVKGCVGLPYLVGNPPVVGAPVITDGSGNVAPVAATGIVGRGQVVALDTTNLIAYVNMY